MCSSFRPDKEDDRQIIPAPILLIATPEPKDDDSDNIPIALTVRRLTAEADIDNGW